MPRAKVANSRQGCAVATQDDLTNRLRALQDENAELRRQVAELVRRNATLRMRNKQKTATKWAAR